MIKPWGAFLKRSLYGKDIIKKNQKIDFVKKSRKSRSEVVHQSIFGSFYSI